MPGITDDFAAWIPGDIRTVAYSRAGVYLDGTGDYVSTPDAAVFGLTADLDASFAVVMSDYTPAATQYLGSKWTTAGDRAYRFGVTSAGLLQVGWNEGGGAPEKTLTSSVAPTITNGVGILLKYTLDVDNGSGNHVGKFYTRPFKPTSFFEELGEGVSEWTQLGSTQNGAGTTFMAPGVAPLVIGAANSANYLNGGVLGFILKDSIDGTEIANPNFTTQGSRLDPFDDDYVNTWTMAGNAYIQPNVADGWLHCDGSIYDIADYEDLFEMISNRFGGDGVTTFAVPNLIGFFPLGSELPGTGAGSASATGLLASGAPSALTANRAGGANDFPANTHTHTTQVPNVKVGYVIKA
jgi:hypothetical protein